jgi:N-acetylmuramoyl-L-alanine amidase
MPTSLTAAAPATEQDGPSAGRPEGARLDAARPSSGRPRTPRTPRTRRSRRWRIARNLAVPLLLGALVTAGSPGWSSYTIHRGDTLSAIAARYHTTVAELVKVNKLPGNGNLIIAGEALRVPVSRAHATTSAPRVHVVVRGDTLSGIAHRYGVSMHRIAKANHLSSLNLVRLGARLRIPGTTRVAPQRTSSSSNSFAGRTYSSSVVAAAARNRATLARRGVPSRTAMRNIIAAKARANGVSPALALAISYQESGWNQRAVSVANAVGAMQVIPSTSAWISTVVGRHLDPLNANDNATIGVVLLRVLTHSASSERQAIAGYYQGLGSVRANGMYSDTKRYVANITYLKRRFS